MRHTITITVEVESDDNASREHVISELCGVLTNVQDETFRRCSVMPDGTETEHEVCTLSVGEARSEGVRVQAGWAV